MNNPQLFSGARGVISLKGKAIAIVTDLSVQLSASLIPSYVVGELNPITIEPVGEDVTVSIGRLIPMNTASAQLGGNLSSEGDATLQSDGLSPSAIGLGLEEQISNILTADGVDIECKDKITGQTMAFVRGCRFAGRVESTGAGGIAQERINYVGIYDSANGNTPNGLGYGVDA